MTRVEPEGAASRGRLILFGRMAGHLATRPVASASRLLFARVVSGVHVGKTARADAVELNDRVLAGPGEVLHPLGHLQESTGLDRLALALVERVADADVERAGDDCHVLVVGVRVGRDLEARGELQADDVAALLARVADEDRLLSAAWQRGRTRPPLDGVALNDRTLLGPRPVPGGQHARESRSHEEIALHSVLPCR